jgi:hypothetical protein
VTDSTSGSVRKRSISRLTGCTTRKYTTRDDHEAEQGLQELAVRETRPRRPIPVAVVEVPRRAGGQADQGVMKAPTNAGDHRPEGGPMTTATARSTTLPRSRNFLKPSTVVSSGSGSVRASSGPMQSGGHGCDPEARGSAS